MFLRNLFFRPKVDIHAWCTQRLQHVDLVQTLISPDRFRPFIIPDFAGLLYFILEAFCTYWDNIVGSLFSALVFNRSATEKTEFFKNKRRCGGPAGNSDFFHSDPHWLQLNLIRSKKQNKTKQNKTDRIVAGLKKVWIHYDILDPARRSQQGLHLYSPNVSLLLLQPLSSTASGFTTRYNSGEVLRSGQKIGVGN